MGMSYTGFGAPVTTKNLQANADLNLGSYDLLCTDAKGDTAEFTEFVGGVGNFDSALVRGNTQIDGNLILDGAINNVNIYNGKITALGGLDGGAVSGTSGTFNYIGLPATTTTTATDYTYATCEAVSFTVSTSAQTIKINGYTYNYALPIKITNGIFITKINGDMPPDITTRVLTVNNWASSGMKFYLKKSTESTYTEYIVNQWSTVNINVDVGTTYNYYYSTVSSVSGTIPAEPTYYLATGTP